MLFLIKNWRALLGLGICMSFMYGTFRFGQLTKEFEYEEAAQKVRERESELITELQTKQAEIEDLKSRGVRRIYVEKDPTGCIDAVVPDGVLAVLGATTNKSGSN